MASQQGMTKAKFSTRVKCKILSRVRALVAATPQATMETAVEQALLAWVAKHPLVSKELTTPKALRSGPPKRRTRPARGLVVIVEDPTDVARGSGPGGEVPQEDFRRLAHPVG